MSNANPLQLLRSNTANKRPDPTALADGRPAVNTNAVSPGLFFKDSAGNLVKVGPVHVGTTAPNASPASGGATGNSLGEQWLDTTGGVYVLKIWDGSAWRSETGTFVDASGDTMTGALVMDNQQQVRFREVTANGTNYIALQAPASVASDKTITLPDVNGTVVTTGDTGTVTSTMIADATIVDADISASAEIAVSKLADGTARQLLQTDAAGTGVEWTSNVDVPGTLDVTGAATFDSTVAVTGALTKSGSNVVTVGDTGTVTSTMILDGTIVNADVNASAAIAGTKISPDFGSQNVTTTGTSTSASFIPTSSAVPTNGVYLPAANSVAISTNGTRRLIITSDGKVGLGSASVLQQGSAIDGGSGAGILELYNGATGNTTLENTGAFPIIFKTNGSERMRLDSSGRLGLGTSSPGFKLTIEDATTPRIRIGDGTRHLNVDGGSTTQNAAIGTDYAGSFGIYTNGAANTRLHVTSAGNVGIGTTSPGSPLTIESNAGNQVKITYPSIASYFLNATSGGDFAINKDGTERARIDSSGRLLVGTSSARSNFFNTSASAALQVEGASGDTRRLSIVSSATGNAPAVLILGRQTSGSIGGNTSVANDSPVGWISFQGNDGAEFVEAASIECYADGTPGANDMPGRLVFSTTADGASSPTERLRITSAGRVGVGASSPQSAVDVLSGVRGVPETSGSTTSVTTLRIRGSSNGVLDIGELSSATAGSYWLQVRDRTNLGFAYNLALQPNGGSVGIGTASPSATLQVSPSSGSANFQVSRGSKGLQINQDNDSADPNINTIGATALKFLRDGSESMRIDTSGRLLVGTSTARSNFFNATETSDFQVESTNGLASIIRNVNAPGGPGLILGKTRSTSVGGTTIVQNGDLIGGVSFQGIDGSEFVVAAAVEAYVDSTPGANDMPGRLVFSTTADGASSPTERMRIGSNGAISLSPSGTTRGVIIGNAFYDPVNAAGIQIANSTGTGRSLSAVNGSGALQDNYMNLGDPATRWGTVYAATGTINTSDANLKQDVEDLDTAELNVANAIKGLIKKFRFVDAVAEKGSDARIHVGVIAQEVEQAFVDEGLDPRRYGLFCEDTLKDGSKRLGIRYDELLAFVVAAL
jgi:hypothetical protein